MSENTLQPGNHILVVSDGSDENWRIKNGLKPLIGGVKSFTETLVPMLREAGFKVTFLHPYSTDAEENPFFARVNVPFYKGFQIAVINPLNSPIVNTLKSGEIDAVFIATPEGPLGFSTKQKCERFQIPYTAAYTTNHGEYIEKITGVPAQAFDKLAQRLFSKAHRVLVPTPIMQRRLNEIGIKNTAVWPRGIDSNLFRPPLPNEESPFLKYDWYKISPNIPVLIYFGRVSKEKNITDFLDIPPEEYKKALGTNCHIVIIGDGPQLEEYKDTYQDRRDIHFLGGFPRKEVPHFVRFADVFVFTSTFDTFGNVILEAGASGVPTIGYNKEDVATQDVIKDGQTGILIRKKSEIPQAVKNALEMDKKICRQVTLDHYSWKTTMELLLKNLVKTTKS